MIAALVLAGLALWSVLLLACWPIAALVLVVAAPPVIMVGWWLHTWSEREAKRQQALRAARRDPGPALSSAEVQVAA
jgi:glucose uptake protein GlcU